VTLLGDAAEPVEVRIQALEVLIGDQHGRADALCRAQLASPSLAQPRPAAGELYLVLRALRHLSERGKLRASELLPLYPLVRRPLAERAADVAELRLRARELVEKARAGARKKELEPDAAALVDFAIERELNVVIEAVGGTQGAVKALAHITGGGLSENLSRVLPDNVAARIDLSSFTVLPVFGWLAQTGRLPDAEMLKTFNCGIGMVMVVAEAEADALVRLLQEWGEAPFLIGEIVPPGGERSDAKGRGDTWAVQYTGNLRYA
jgi:hypothetical protein